MSSGPPQGPEATMLVQPLSVGTGYWTPQAVLGWLERKVDSHFTQGGPLYTVWGRLFCVMRTHGWDSREG